MTGSGQVWSGDIVLGDNSAPLQDITFSASSNSKLENGVSLLENAELTFLSFVVPSRIPLYLVAGRSLDVWTDNEATESWFRDFLLHSPDRSGRDRGEEEDKYTAWWDTHRCQSDVGALLRVRDRSGSADSNPRAPGPKITEVLLYGTLLEAQNARQLPTPPSSSSPVPLALGDGDAASGALTASVMKQLTVHALLLSSELAYSEAQAVITTAKPSAGGPATVEAIPSARGGSETVDAQFLPPLFQDKKHGNHASLKRRRAETLFEDATNKVRKARRGGGKRVSQIMVDVTSSGSGAFPPLPPATQAVTNKAETQNLGPEYPVNAEGKLANSRGPPREGSVCTRPQSSDAQLSWSAVTRPGSPPIPNVVRSKEGKETGQTRIASRRNTLNSITRPSTSLSSNTATTVDGNCQNSLAEVVLEPQSLPEAQKTIEMRNKELLSRIVMAGMRIYGLQQQKKTSKFRDVPEGSALNGSHTPLETDEYKLVYHQTFKGACFAFRRHIVAASLKPDCMRDVVDRLLAVFCNDPSAVAKSESENAGAFGQEGAEKSPFAPESGQRRNQGPGVSVSTPRVRRRFVERGGGEAPSSSFTVTW